MMLKSDWRDVLKRAWSVRFIVIAGMFSAAEVVVPLFADALPRGMFAVLSAVSVGGAFVSRLVVQKDIT